LLKEFGMSVMRIVPPSSITKPIVLTKMLQDRAEVLL
jgi:hypothetical protein